MQNSWKTTNVWYGWLLGCFLMLTACDPLFESKAYTPPSYPEPTTEDFTINLASRLSQKQLAITLNKCFYFDFNPSPNGLSLKYPLAAFSNKNHVAFDCLQNREPHTQLDIDAIIPQEMFIPHYDHFQDYPTNLNHELRVRIYSAKDLLEKHDDYVVYRSGHKLVVVYFNTQYPFMVVFTPDEGETKTGYFDDQYKVTTVLHDDFAIQYQVYGNAIVDNLYGGNPEITRQFQDFFARNQRDKLTFAEAIAGFDAINRQVVDYFMQHSTVK